MSILSGTKNGIRLKLDKRQKHALEYDKLPMFPSSEVSFGWVSYSFFGNWFLLQCSAGGTLLFAFYRGIFKGRFFSSISKSINKMAQMDRNGMSVHEMEHFNEFIQLEWV